MAIRTETIEFTEQLGFSKLFKDYLRFGEFFRNRFPGNKLSTDPVHLSRIAERYGRRGELGQAIRKSMECTDLSDAQSANIQKIGESNSLAITTGQQPGFLGGPLYTYLKAATAISSARRIAERNPSFDFVPIFWVEDNDHDSREASVSYILSKENTIRPIDSALGEHPADVAVSSRQFSAAATEQLGQIIDELPYGEFKEELEELLSGSITEGRGWAESFIQILNAVFSDSGLLFVRSSVLRRMGFFDGPALAELENCTSNASSHMAITQANEHLEQAGYHIQAKSKMPNLFAHFGELRQKIVYSEGSFQIGSEKYSKEELIELGRKSPGSFSPNVLLRPVFQDLALPNIAYIGGPAEIGYAAQIKGVYSMFGADMPAYFSRHSATIIPAKIAAAAEKSGFDPKGLFIKKLELESILTSRLAEGEFGSEFNRATELLAQSFELLERAFDEKKLGIGAAVKSHERAAMQQIEHLEKKALAAMKKFREADMQRAFGAKNFLFPEDTLQERILTAANLISQLGLYAFRNLILEIAEMDTSNHIIVYL